MDRADADTLSVGTDSALSLVPSDPSELRRWFLQFGHELQLVKLCVPSLIMSVLAAALAWMFLSRPPHLKETVFIASWVVFVGAVSTALLSVAFLRTRSIRVYPVLGWVLALYGLVGMIGWFSDWHFTLFWGFWLWFLFVAIERANYCWVKLCKHEAFRLAPVQKGALELLFRRLRFGNVVEDPLLIRAIEERVLLLPTCAISHPQSGIYQRRNVGLEFVQVTPREVYTIEVVDLHPRKNIFTRDIWPSPFTKPVGNEIAVNVRNSTGYWKGYTRELFLKKYLQWKGTTS